MLINKQFLKFSTIGGLLLLLDNFLMYVFLELGFERLAARSIVLILTLCLSFCLNSKITFRKSFSFKKFIMFMGGVGALNLLSYLISVILMYSSLNFSPFLALNFGAALVFSINFFYQRFLFNRV